MASNEETAMHHIVSLRDRFRLERLLAIIAVMVSPFWLAHTLLAAAPYPEKLNLWTKQAPLGDGTFEAVDTPITVHLPDPAKANGAAVVLCAGGGYGGLVIDAEGHNIAKWLNEHGIAGIVLQYRLPKGRFAIPLLDAQRALRTARANAKKWNINADRVGIMGFSAGGHLAATAGTLFDAGDPKAADPVDRLNCRPDFVILVYPVITMGDQQVYGGETGTKQNLMGRNPRPELIERFSAEKQVTDKTPPTFLAHSVRDTCVSVKNSQMMVQALKAKNVPVEYMELTTGEHTLNALWGKLWDSIRVKILVWLEEQKMIPHADAAVPVRPSK